MQVAEVGGAQRTNLIEREIQLLQTFSNRPQSFGWNACKIVAIKIQFHDIIAAKNSGLKTGQEIKRQIKYFN